MCHRQPPAQHNRLRRQIRLAIDARGQHYWDGQPVSRDELGPRFAAAVSREPNVELALQADKSLRYDSVAQALATAQRSGISRIGFVTTAP
nr:biopolymer transporter ExbD [Paludibacterium denitrificans]